MKRIFQAIITFFVIICMITSAFASSPKSSDRINRFDVNAKAAGNGEILIEVYMTTTDVMDALGIENLTILRKSGSTWVEVESYDQNDEGMCAYNSVKYTNKIKFFGTAGKNYKIQAEFFAENASGYESRVKTDFVTA